MTRLIAASLIAVLFVAVLSVTHRESSVAEPHQGPTATAQVVAPQGTAPTLPPARSPGRRNHLLNVCRGSETSPGVASSLVTRCPRRHRIPAIWRKLAFCESSGRWSIVNPPYSGGLQFRASTWTSFDTRHYAPTADQATPWQQVQVARHVLRVQGVGAWPVCGPKAGLR